VANWTTPHTWATNEVVTAALLNQYQRDNLQYLHDRYVVMSGNPLTLTPGTWLLLATFQTEGSAAVAINRAGVAQVAVGTSTKSAPSLIWIATVAAASEVWHAGISGTAGSVVSFIAVRLAA
jgi:hypothetical protein